MPLSIINVDEMYDGRSCELIGDGVLNNDVIGDCVTIDALGHDAVSLFITNGTVINDVRDDDLRGDDVINVNVLCIIVEIVFLGNEEIM